MVELLSTKLFVPRSRPNLVSRPHLTTRLNAGLDKKLTLIAAPAGFGKTTLLGEWISKSDRDATWLSLDEFDNTPARFWTYFIAALQTLSPNLGEHAQAFLHTLQPPPIETFLTVLINEINAFDKEIVHVFDDYHVIESKEVDEGLTYLIEHLPPNLHLVINTRINPSLPLSRLRARNQLNELRAKDLRFTALESASFLTQVMELNLSGDEIEALGRRIEGWIAGLQIVALSMQGRDDLPGFVDTFSGSHRHILGYLSEEVLNQQPPRTLEFLLQTSILDRLCGPLCDAVTGGSDGQEILENLERANLFITTIDEQGKWYRYHPLFGEVLQARNQQTQNDIVSTLHRRAGEWYRGEGMIEEAIQHALAGDDFEAAAVLIENTAGNLVRQGSSSSLVCWLDEMPDETVRSRPRLCLARGWTNFMGAALDLDQANEWAERALLVASASGMPEPELSGEAYTLKAMIAVTRGEIKRSRELAQQALNDLPSGSPWRCAVTFCLGTTNLDAGDLKAAAQAFSEALSLNLCEGAQYIRFAAASFLGQIQIFQGQLRRAKETYEQVLAWAERAPPQKGGVMAHAGLADILYEQNQLEAALAHIQAGMEQANLVGGAWSAFVLYRVLYRVQSAQGNCREALDTLNHAYEMGKSAQVSLVETLAAALRAEQQLDCGDLQTAGAWAASCGLSLEEPGIDHPGWRTAEYLVLARVLDAQGKHSEALSLLERLLKSAQSEERVGGEIEILALQAWLHEARGDRIQAIECLERSLTLAEPEGYMRVFIENGEDMRSLLTGYRMRLVEKLHNGVDVFSLRLLTYSERLLAAFSQPGLTGAKINQFSSEALSERELEILRLIAAGKSNKEIAEILVVAVSTVKTHINHLYGKLGASRRTQAIAIAREASLLQG